MNSPQERHPVAYGLREIRLNDGASRDAFERFVLESFFPTVDTSQGTVFGPDQHTLLQQDWPSAAYVWVSRVEYSVHHTPFPGWLFERFTACTRRRGSHWPPLALCPSRCNRSTTWRAQAAYFPSRYGNCEREDVARPIFR